MAMNKRLLAVAFISVLLASMLVGAQYVKKANADPYVWYGTVPARTSTIPPVISIYSPGNNSVYNTNDILLSLNVSGPPGPGVYYPYVDKVECKVDWQDTPLVLVHLNGSASIGYISGDGWTEWTPFSRTLNLTNVPDGNHWIEINATYGGIYTVPEGTAVIAGFHINSSSTVFFTVNSSPASSPSPSPSPTLAPTLDPTIEPTSTPKQISGFLGTSLPVEYGYAIVAVLVIAVIAGLSLVYFKKLRK